MTYSLLNSKNTRAKKMNKIMSEIAKFMFMETYIDEQDH